MIMIDDRVGSRELAPILDRFGIQNCVTRLNSADAAFMGNGPGDSKSYIGVERKAIMDMLSSMASGRLSGHQLIQLKKDYHFSYILIEGIWRCDNDGVLVRYSKGRFVPAALGQRRFTAREIWNYINTLQILCGINVVRTGSLVESAFWIGSTYRWWNKSWFKHTSHTQFHQTPEYASLTKPGIVSRMAMELSGIGHDKAVKIGKHFPYPIDMVAADREDWEEIEGIGTKLSKSIMEELGSNEDG